MIPRVPYALRGNSVVKSDSGEVVKTHPTREKALAHLRALKANVEEGAVARPDVLGSLLEGAEVRVQEAIGSIEKGAFHRWLGKKQDEPITDADIERGLKAGGHPAKMAAFAKASRKFGK